MSLAKKIDAAPLLPENFSRWFSSRGWTPRAHQLELLSRARDGRSVLLIAPTGGGKTLAGFLPTLVELSEAAAGRAGSLPRLRGRVREGAIPPPAALRASTSPASGGGEDVARQARSLISTGRDIRRGGGLHTLYISPLKALAV